MIDNGLIEENSHPQEILEEKKKGKIRLINGNNINLILLTIFISIIIISFINFIFQKSPSPKHKVKKSSLSKALFLYSFLTL